MIVKIVKIFLALSLVLWAVWGHFQGGSLCLTTLFFYPHLFSHGVEREGCSKQTALSCAHRVSAPLDLSLLAVHKPLRLYDAQLGTVWGRP